MGGLIAKEHDEHWLSSLDSEFSEANKPSEAWQLSNILHPLLEFLLISKHSHLIHLHIIKFKVK